MTHQLEHVASVSEKTSGLNPSTQIEQDLKNAVDRIEKKFRPNMQNFRKSPKTRIKQNEELIR